MKSWLFIVLIGLLFVDNYLYAQHITPSSSKKEIKEFLKNKEGDEVEFCSIHKDIYFVRDKKTDKWGMFDWYGMLVPMKYDTIQRFEQFQQFTIGKKDGKNVVIQWPYDTEGEGVREVDGYDELMVKRNGDEKISSASYFLLASKNGKWGCLDWQTLKELVPCNYASPEEALLSSTPQN